VVGDDVAMLGASDPRVLGELDAALLGEAEALTLGAAASSTTGGKEGDFDGAFEVAAHSHVLATHFICPKQKRLLQSPSILH